MRVDCAGHSAAVDQGALARTVRSLLGRAVTDLNLRAELDRALPLEPDAGPPPCYPGLVALAHRVRPTGDRAGVEDAGRIRVPARFAAQLTEQLTRAQGAAERVRKPLAGGWHVDLAPAEPHLEHSVRRALAQIPPRDGHTPTASVLDWPEQFRAPIREAAELVAHVWPAMFAELCTVVRQLAVISGVSIHGFTDFATHGVVYLGSARFDIDAGGLPVHCQLAEALVHEATHNRCNVASLTTRFFQPDAGDEQRVSTPLRADPRPLAGLFQQIVVLARSVLLYQRILNDRGWVDVPRASTALRSRYDELVEQGRRGLSTARTHAAALSEHGLDVLDQSEVILRHTGLVREPAS